VRAGDRRRPQYDRLSADRGQPVSLSSISSSRRRVTGADEQWYEATTDDTGSTCEKMRIYDANRDWTRCVSFLCQIHGHFAAPYWASATTCAIARRVAPAQVAGELERRTARAIVGGALVSRPPGGTDETVRGRRFSTWLKSLPASSACVCMPAVFSLRRRSLG